MRTLDSVYRNHPDHIAAGEAACCAVYPDSRNPFTFPELLDEGHTEWTVEELWIMGSGPDADTFVDITDTFDRKLKALRCHVSQMTDPDGIEVRLREWGTANARAGGLGDGRLAEAFRVMDTR